jgi:anthranilate synthase component 1|tara:strand:+ start:510 stop:1892 length:1383 start_codon:yes stop_codon:yes gene_type:complete
MNLKTKIYATLADTLTPVSIYLKLRDLYPNSILLESNLNEKRDKSHSYICLNPIASFKAFKTQISIVKNGQTNELNNSGADAPKLFSSFLNEFKVDGSSKINAVFGHTNYNAIEHFDTIKLSSKELDNVIPLMHYSLYRFVIAIDHFSNEMTFTEYLQEEEQSQLEALISTVQTIRFNAYTFNAVDEESCFTSSKTFLDQVNTAQQACRDGNIFQIVISRRFKQKFKGDEFQVYRSLRSINPSPYLYYFDMGSYKIFGSSPEAQIKINDGKAIINPIAGTYRRTGNNIEDEALAATLKKDPKENSEHVMLVDLARNDLGKVSRNIDVKSFKDIHYYSHVIHMVSEVQGELPANYDPIQVMGQSFPAGTLSGAPKYRAMQLIDQLEPVSRNYYGGGIGFVELNGNLNHAIMIRSFLSQNNELHYQAGAGVVVGSVPENELEEIDNKVGALKMAIKKAADIQ